MAAGDDAWTYWNAMQAFPIPVTPQDVPTVLVSCSADLGGSDNTYTDRCPDPWVEVRANPTAELAAGLVFSRVYFEWSQRYVREAILHKPLSSASAKAKVLWLLDVSTVMMLGLVATNIPLNSRHPLWSAWDSLRKEFTVNLELMRQNMLTRYANQRTEVLNAVMAPAPFFIFPLEWSRAFYRSPRGPDQIYQRIYGSLTLHGGWTQFDNLPIKNAGEAASAVLAGDAPMYRGIQQWRLWCVRDGTGTDTTVAPLAPLHQGAWNNAPTLSEYIGAVQTAEVRTAELVLISGAAGGGRSILYPNFETIFQSFERMTAPFLGMRMDKLVQDQLSRWITDSMPKLDANGVPREPRLPVTFPDYVLILKKQIASLSAIAKVALANPTALCGAAGPYGSSCGWSGARTLSVPSGPGLPTVPPIQIPSGQQAMTQLNTVTQQGIQHSPLGPLYNVMMLGESWLVGIVGMAVGVFPFRAITQPFVRSFTLSGYRTIVDGSTVDVIPRVLTAVLGLSQLVGLNLCAQCPPLPASAVPVVGSPGTPGPLPSAYMPSPAQLALMRQVQEGMEAAKPKAEAAFFRNLAQHNPFWRVIWNFTHAGNPYRS